MALTKPLPPLWGLFLCLAGSLPMPPQQAMAADSLERSLTEQRGIQWEAAQAQQRIDALDDESRRMLMEYQAIQDELDNLNKYNRQMSRMLAAQETEITDLETQAREVEVTRQRILPLMLEMLNTLERFVSADTPFLVGERALRLKGMRKLLDEPKHGLEEKYRRILEAYSVEADYAYGIEAYSGKLNLNGEPDGHGQTVDYLRLGRTGLYWLSLDRKHAGLWDPRTDRWHDLPDEDHAAIERAIRMARKQAPPDLLRLPVRAAALMP